MAIRNRSRQTPRGPGWKERKITTNPPVRTDSLNDSASSMLTRETSIDTVGEPNEDHPLTIEFFDNSRFLFLDGVNNGSGGSYQKFVNWQPTAAIASVSHLSTSIPSVGARATTLQARTNPSREEVSIPNFIHELKDLPGMYKDIMAFKTRLKTFRSLRGGARTSSNYLLSTQMGWIPLISDLRKLAQFQNLVDKRVQELNRLYSSKGLKRRQKLYSEIVSSQEDIFADTSLGINIRVRKYTTTVTESWGTIRWRPTSVPKDFKRQDLGRVARRLVLGLHHNGIDAVQAWNAIPWTWLADWFGNVGEYLEAHRNVIPAQPDAPCNIMRRDVTYEAWERLDGFNTIIGASGIRKLTTKRRSLSSGSLSVSLPFISKRQWSILGALAIQRKTR